VDPYPAHPVTQTDPDIQFVISSAGMPASSPAATGARPQRRSYGRVMQPSSCPCARDIGLFGCVHEVLGRDPLQYWPRLWLTDVWPRGHTSVSTHYVRGSHSEVLSLAPLRKQIPVPVTLGRRVAPDPTRQRRGATSREPRPLHARVVCRNRPFPRVQALAVRDTETKALLYFVFYYIF